MLAAVVVVTLPAVAGCSSDDAAPTPVTTESADPEAQNLLGAGANATKTLASAHVGIALEGQFDRLGQATAVDGDAQASPLVVNGTVTYQNGETAPLVIANDTVSVKQGGVWNDVGATSALIPPAIIDARQGLPHLLNGAQSAQVAGSESIDGVDTTKVTATIPADEAAGLVPEATGPADLTVWIRKAGDPVLVRALIKLSASQSMTVTLSKWNVPVKVSPALAP
ncbi:LppX_LprAFG lipoprotein [Mycobacterium syngnathidarum]|uniref:LppX_LprAFG lipoprotein n=1 Tax=Mycobacterium syngnathidarum TaxID=1908205 RepID=UPI0013F4FAA7|nr:LppX_LprAFG lipoprotein [Mycobacterium syngnathidarum]